MKKFLFPLALVTVASLVFSSCQKEMEKPDAVSGFQELHFHVKGYQKEQETRTYLDEISTGTYRSYWKNGDVLGAFLDGTTISGSTAAVDMTLTNGASDGATGEFEGTVVASGSGTFQAFYPASAFEKGYAGGGIGLNIGDKNNSYKQHPAVGSPDPTCDILVSKACDYLSDGDDVIIDDLYFTRPLSILKINLKGSYAEGEEIQWLKFAVSAGTLSGRVNLDLSTLDINEWTSDQKYAWAEYTTSKPIINDASDNTVFLVVNPTTLTSGTTVTVTGETAHVEIEKTFTLSADMTFPAGGIATLNLTINAADCSVKASENYTLVTTSGAFEAGSKYVFAFKDGKDGHYEFINNTGSSKTIDNATLTVTAGVISSPNSKYTFTAETGENSGTFNFKNSSDNYIYNSGSGTTLNTNSVSKTDWLPTFIDASKTYKIQNTNTSGRYISHNGGTDAKAYANSNFNDQVAGSSELAQNDGAISVFKYTDSRSKLGTPGSLTVSSKTVSWAAVANAGSYTVSIGANDYVTTSTSYTYTGVDGYFDVAVVAHPTIAVVDTYKDSDAAVLSKVTFGTPTLATPELANGGVTATTVTVTWTDDPNATAGYHCEIYNGLSKVNEEDVALDVESVTFSGLTKGTEYTVKVNAKAVTGGSYPWVASEVASINMTPAGQTVSSVTSAGSYNLTDLTVMAVNGKNVIMADATGAILLYKDGHGLSVGDVRTVNGYTQLFNGVYEFYTDGSHPLSITGSTSTTPAYPSPVTYDASKITSYASSPVTEYATATGVADSGARTVTVATGKILNVYGDLSSVDGKQVIVTGYAFGYSASKVNFMLVGAPTLDPSVPSLTTTPASGSTIEWDDDEYGAGNSQNITVTLNGAATGYTVSSGTAAWTVSDNGSGTITVYPKAANESTTDDKTLDVTITHKDNGGLTSTITLKQKKQGAVSPTTYSSTLTSASWGSTGDFGWTSGKAGAGYSNNGIQVTTTASGANGTTNKTFTGVTQVVVTYNTNKSAGAGKLKAKIGSNAETEQSWGYSGSSDGRTANFTCTFSYLTPQDGVLKLTATTTTNSIYIVSVDVTATGISD